MTWDCLFLLLFERFFKYFDNAFPNLKNREKAVTDAILPFIILPVFLLIGTISVTMTAVEMIVIGMGYLYTASRPKTKSSFFYAWTISSIVTMYAGFQVFVTHSTLVTELEITATHVLTLLTCYLFYKMKIIASELVMIAKELDSSAIHSLPLESRYCRICRVTVKERLFHSIWWDCCVSKSNYLYFLNGHMFALIAILYGINLSLTSLCENTKFLDNILVPLQCINVYDSDLRHALPFVTCMYGLAYSIIVMSVLIRQLSIYIPKYAEMQFKKSSEIICV